MSANGAKHHPPRNARRIANDSTSHLRCTHISQAEVYKYKAEVYKGGEINKSLRVHTSHRSHLGSRYKSGCRGHAGLSPSSWLGSWRVPVEPQSENCANHKNTEYDTMFDYGFEGGLDEELEGARRWL